MKETYELQAAAVRRVLAGAPLSAEDRQRLERAALNLESFGRLRQTVLRACRGSGPEASDTISQQIMRVLHLKEDAGIGNESGEGQAAHPAAGEQEPDEIA